MVHWRDGGCFITGLAEWHPHYLKSDVLNLKTVVQVVRGILEKSVTRWTIRHHQMCGECNLRGAHGPDMKIVNLTNSGE